MDEPRARQNSGEPACVGSKGASKSGGGISLNAIFLFLLICSVSAGKIYLNWGGSMVHLADALPGKKRPQFQSQLDCFLSLSSLESPRTSLGLSSNLSRGFKSET